LPRRRATPRREEEVSLADHDADPMPVREPGGSLPVAAPEAARPILRLAAVCYSLLLAAGFGWTWLRTGRLLPESLPGADPLGGLWRGSLAGCAVVVVSAMLVRASPWMRWLTIEFRTLLGPLGAGGCLYLAIASGAGEEVFFRGAMQPVFGLVPTSLLFGLVHVGPDRRFLGWTGFAVATGFLLGWLLEGTHSLLAPLAAHVLINFLNLLQIMRLNEPAEG
jgi:uncharacterized protein